MGALRSLRSTWSTKFATTRAGPYVILFVGVNGTGKTTTVAKIAGCLTDARTLRGRSQRAIRSGPARSSSCSSTARSSGSGSSGSRRGSDPAAVAFDAMPAREGQVRRRRAHRYGGTSAHQREPHRGGQEDPAGGPARRSRCSSATRCRGTTSSSRPSSSRAHSGSTASSSRSSMPTRRAAPRFRSPSSPGKPIVLVGPARGTATSLPSTRRRCWIASSPRRPGHDRQLEVVLVRPKEDGNVGRGGPGVPETSGSRA